MRSSPNIFDPRAVAFGRAQTFPLRLGWLPKMCNLILAHKTAPSTDDFITELGVGKNMVTSMLHWARATDVLTDKNKLTDFGKRIFSADGLDPYMEAETTLWLLHWKIASRPHCFTAGYALFNIYFNSAGFLPEEATVNLALQLRRLGVNFSEATLRRDVDTTLRMYARRNNGLNEESLESPFLNLDLISYAPTTNRYHSGLEPRDSLPAGVVGFAAAELLTATEGKEIIIRGNLRNEKSASLDAAFRLTEEALLQKLSSFCVHLPIFRLRESAGEWQLFLSGDPPKLEQLLATAYTSEQRKDVLT